jgi:hypothetical protein
MNRQNDGLNASRDDKFSTIRFVVPESHFRIREQAPSSTLIVKAKRGFEKSSDIFSGRERSRFKSLNG